MKMYSRMILVALLVLSLPVYALDIVAPVSERQFGVLFVRSPMPKSDIVTINPKSGGGKKQTTAPETEIKVPVGDYQVTVKMQDYQYDQQVTVKPTERTEVVVPGYGNLKVIAPQGGSVEVYKTGTESLVAKFPADQIKVLPTGYYDVKIIVGKVAATQSNVWIVTNTTREVVIKL